MIDLGGLVLVDVYMLVEWRGKKIDSGGEWLTGSLYDDGGELYILPPFPGSAIDYEDYQIDPNTLGLWIWKTDKHGHKIWTGDVIRDRRGRIWRVDLLSLDLFQFVLKGEEEIVKGLLGFEFEECEKLSNTSIKA